MSSRWANVSFRFFGFLVFSLRCRVSRLNHLTNPSSDPFSRWRS